MNRWQKIGIGIAIFIVVVVAFGFVAKNRMQNFFYPLAPPMPAVVSETMPEILARLEIVLKNNAPHVVAGLQSGLSAEAIAKLEEQYHLQVPDDIKAIYEWHNGAVHTTNYLGGDFIPTHRFVPLEEALEDFASVPKGPATSIQMAAYRLLAGHRDSWISLFADGAGDGYWYDPKRKPAEGAVFYNFAETGTFEFFPSPKNLMAGIATCYEVGAFHTKAGMAPPELDESYQQAQNVWQEYGAGN